MIRKHQQGQRKIDDQSRELLASLEFRPLTTKNWRDLVELLGPKGGWGGCWCMWWRRSPSAFKENKGEKNKQALHRIVGFGQPTGVLAYAQGKPVGWCAVAPREVYTRLATSRVLKPVDAEPVWSVSCFYVKREYRRAGLSIALLNAAVDYARRNGARIVEGYPQDIRKDVADAFAWTGLVSTFLRAGFKEVARRSPKRLMMRKESDLNQG